MLHLFDLDHTLVHTLPHCTPGFTCVTTELNGYELFVHIRPHAVEFIRMLQARGMNWGIWTTGSRDYMCDVVNGLLELTGLDAQPNVLLCRDDTTQLNATSFVKSLERFGQTDVILYDDSKLNVEWSLNRGRVKLVPKFDVTHRHAHLDCFFLQMRCETC